MDEQSIFALALEKASAGERVAFLDEACAGDAKLRAAVEALRALGADPLRGDKP